jgi:hypothetical protein
VPGKPEAVLAWVKANSPALAKLRSAGGITGDYEGTGAIEYGAFYFGRTKPGYIESEELFIVGSAGEDGSTVLRAETHVSWIGENGVLPALSEGGPTPDPCLGYEPSAPPERATEPTSHAKTPDWRCASPTPSCATLVVRVAAVGCDEETTEGRECPAYPEETATLRIAKLGSRPRCRLEQTRCWGKVLGNWYTKEHKVHLAPGRYGITLRGYKLPAKSVVARAGQELEVKLEIERM